MKNAKPKERKMHVTLPDEVHQKLRVKCALEDVTIQEYVSRLIEQDIKDVLVLAFNNSAHCCLKVSEGSQSYYLGTRKGARRVAKLEELFRGCLVLHSIERLYLQRR